MKRHPLSRPTVYVDSIPSLRWRRAAMRFLGPKRRLRKALGAVGILAVLLGSVGVMHTGGHGSEATANPASATCQDESHAHAVT